MVKSGEIKVANVVADRYIWCPWGYTWVPLSLRCWEDFCDAFSPFWDANLAAQVATEAWREIKAYNSEYLGKEAKKPEYRGLIDHFEAFCKAVDGLLARP